MIKKLNNLYEKLGIYLLSLGVIILNFSIAFDNVVWGDEAYSQMAIKNCDFYGIFQRVYYWDSHPPLYYYYLRIFADAFGYKTPVYHIASLVPFVIGIILSCTLIKKHLGAYPATFFIIVSGLSASCSEYNLEIRMYSLVFMFVLLCIYCAYTIIKEGSKISYFIFMTLFGILAAYTHYYGLALCGLIIFYTGLFAFLNKKSGANFLKWAISTLIYIVAYIPWLFVLYFQTQAELGNSWMTEPDPFGRVLSFISGGERLKFIILTFVIVMSVYICLTESNILIVNWGGKNGKTGVKSTKASKSSKHENVARAEKIAKPADSKKVVAGNAKFISFGKPSVKAWSPELKGILLLWLSGASLLVFGYGVSYLFHPILTFRYVYVLIPVVLYIFMLCMKKFVEYAMDIRVKYGIIWTMLLLTLILALFDFKYFRSVTKTQDYQTNLILDIIGTPNEDAVMVANNVKHLGWSVLKYYYDNEITMEVPSKVPQLIGAVPSEIWAFAGLEYDENMLEEMEYMGYNVEVHMNMWLGKYGVNLYHFYQ